MSASDQVADAEARPEAVERSIPAEAQKAPCVPASTRGVPPLVWWITALYVTLLLAYSILLPPYRAPDEPLHLSLAREFAEELHYPAWDEGRIDLGIQRSLRTVRFGQDSRHLTEAEAPPKGDRPTLEELARGDPRSGVNPLSQHPPLYYVVTGTMMRVTNAIVGDPIGGFDVETWAYRLMSVLLVAPLTLITWQTSRRLGLPEPVGIAATLVPLAIPQLTHIGSSVNNDNLLLLLFWGLTPVIVRIAAGDLRVRTAVLAGALTGLALLTKGFALVMLVWVAAALVLALRRGGRAVVSSVMIATCAYTATSLAMGGWWWVRNVVVFGKVSPSRFYEVVPTRDGVQLDLSRFLDVWGERTMRRFWGRFGWHDTGLPDVLVIAATVVVLVALVIACRRQDRVAGTSRGARILLLAPLVLLLANQGARALRGHLDTGRWPGIQGRYLFGAVAALAVLVALGLAQLLRARLQWLPFAILAAAALMQAFAAASLLSFYWGEPGSALGDRLRAVVAWAPIPGELIAAGAVIGVVVIAATTVQVVRLAVTGTSGPGGARRSNG